MNVAGFRHNSGETSMVLFLVAFAAIGAVAATAYFKSCSKRCTETLRELEKSLCWLACAALVGYPIVRFFLLKGNEGTVNDGIVTALCIAVFIFWGAEKVRLPWGKKTPHAAE